MSGLLDAFDQAAAAAAPAASGNSKSSRLTSAFDEASAHVDRQKAAPASTARSPMGSGPSTGPSSEMDAQAATGGAILHGLTGLGATIAGGYRGLATLVAPKMMGADPRDSRVDAAVKAIQSTQNDYTYNPPEDSDAAHISDALGSKYSPLMIPSHAGAALGTLVNSAPNQVAGVDITAPKAALSAGVDAGTQVLAPGGLAKYGGRMVAPLRALADAPTRIAPEVAPAAPAAAVPAVADSPSPTVAQAPISDLQATPPAALTLDPQAPVPERVAGFPAEVGQPATRAPVVAPPRTAANAPTISDAANGIFAESNPDVAGGLPAPEQARRAAVLQAVGLDRVRASAVTGDARAASTDFQTSRLDSPAGREMQRSIDSEKAALSNYVERIAQDTGGSAMNDQAAKLGRGNTIVAPLDALKDYFDKQTSDLYKTADERAQGVPTQLDGFRTVLGDDSLATNSDRINLRSAIGSYAKKLGVVDDQGGVFANAQQAETMRKYLNENWSPQNSGLVGKLKDALDDDVTKAAGEDVYGAARAMRTQRAQTLDNPNGIANLMDSSGPINRKVPIERIADTITNMPVAQLGHIVDTLKNVPPDIQPQAQAALAEVKAQYAHNVAEIGMKQAGQWNAKGVRQYLANNSARMAQVFTADEMQRFGTLNDAGNILAKDQSYPGAAVQQHNLVRAGVAHGITAGMTTAGGAVAGPAGAALGSILGGKLAGKFNDSANLRATQKRMTNLSDLASDGTDR